MPRTLKNAERVEVSPDAILAQSAYKEGRGAVQKRERGREIESDHEEKVTIEVA